MLRRVDVASLAVVTGLLLMAVAAPARPKRAKRSPTRIDWVKARAFAARLGQGRTLQAVADEFACTPQAVRLAWKRYDWDDYFAEYDARVDAAVARDTILTGEQRAIQNARLRDLSGAALLRKVSKPRPELEDHSLVRVWEKSGHDVRLDTGGPTERVEAVQRVAAVLPQYLGDVLAALLPHIPVERHELALADFDGVSSRYSEQLALPAPEAEASTEEATS